VASGTKVESIEEEIQEIKIEDMESRNQERRMAGVFKETPLIFENAVTLVNHQLFDQSPQPNQVKLSKSLGGICFVNMIGGSLRQSGI